MRAQARQTRRNHPVRKIGLVGDFLRFEIEGDRCLNFQPRNLAWLHQMLTPALQDAGPDIQFDVILAPTSVNAMAKACANSDIFDAYREDAAQAWANLYTAERPLAFQGLFERLLDFDLIVGFELPAVTKRYLHASGKHYINLFVHPLRFLRDLCLGATTNSPQILDSLKHCAVPSDEVQHQAARFKGYFRRRQLERLAIPAGLPVLIGQTERDSVLITADGKFDTWGAHADELRNALSGTDAVVFLEHPMRPSSAIAIQEIRAATGKTVIATTANGYGLLMSNPEIPFVMTLASSLGVEAQAMGIAAHFLLADPRDKLIIPGLDLSPREPLGHGLWSQAFWQEVLRASPEPMQAASADPFALGESYVRNSLETWAFRGLQNGLESQVVRKTVALSPNMAEARQDELLAGLLGYAPDNSCSPGRAIRQAAHVGVHLDILQPPLCLGESQQVRLDQPSAAFTLLKGFHSPEPWGCWTSELRSELLLLVAQDAIEQDAVIEVAMQFHLFDGLAEKCPVLKVSDDDEALGYVFFRPGHTKQECTFAMAVQSTMVRVCLELSCIDSPAARGESTDDRWLGIGLDALTISCKPKAAAKAMSDAHLQPAWGLGTAKTVAAVT